MTSFSNYPNGEIQLNILKNKIKEYKNKLLFNYDIRYISINETHMVYTTNDNQVYLLNFN